MARSALARAERATARGSVVYKWAENYRGVVQPEVVAAEVEKLWTTKGEIRPDDLIERSRPADSPIHDLFTWDDADAAQKYRLEEARHVLRSLVVAQQTDDGRTVNPQRLIVKLMHRRNESVEGKSEVLRHAVEPHVYLPAAAVMADDDARNYYVRMAFLEAWSWRQRYKNIAKLAAIHAAIDAMAPHFGITA